MGKLAGASRIRPWITGVIRRNHHIVGGHFLWHAALEAPPRQRVDALVARQHSCASSWGTNSAHLYILLLPSARSYGAGWRGGLGHGWASCGSHHCGEISFTADGFHTETIKAVISASHFHAARLNISSAHQSCSLNVLQNQPCNSYSPPATIQSVTCLMRLFALADKFR